MTIVAGATILASDHNNMEIVKNAATRYLGICPADFVPYTDAIPFSITQGSLWTGNVSGSTRYYYAAVHLPHGATVTSVKGSFNILTASDGTGTLGLYEVVRSTAASTELAHLDATSTGLNELEDTTITNPTINNLTNIYTIVIGLYSPTHVTDIEFRGGVITYTITVPLP